VEDPAEVERLRGLSLDTRTPPGEESFVVVEAPRW
jgi:hypothetical protein